MIKRKNYTPGRFYLLPKIHKLNPETLETTLKDPNVRSKMQIPGRPIIAQSGSVTEKIAKLLDYVLLPIVQKTGHIYQRQETLYSKIENIKVPDDILIVSYDVTSMYSNMHIEEIKAAVNRALNNIRNEDYDITVPSKGNLLV